jgi:23S rRNA (guanosine2251-2'-O)-methyltransferase
VPDNGRCQVKDRAQLKTEVLYGIHPVKEALAAGRREIFEVCLATGKGSPRGDALRQAAESRGVSVREVLPAQLTSMAGTESHQGVAARVSVFACEDLADVWPPAGGTGPELLLALDSIQDPHNLGALLRTALCAGVQAVIVPKDRSAPPTPAVSRVSAGALEHTRLVQVTNLVRSLELVKARGPWVAGLEREARATVFSTDWTMPLVLVVGGEGKGMRPLVTKTCDLLVSIPQAGPLDSLNASVAAAVTLYEIFRQRQAADRQRLIGDRPDGRGLR